MGKKQSQKSQVKKQEEPKPRVRFRSGRAIKARSGYGKAWDFHMASALAKIAHAPQRKVTE